MQRSDLSFQQIYNTLLAGKRLVLYFVDATSAETFRTRMAHHKAKQQKTLEDLGMWVSEERTILHFKLEKNKEEGAVDVTAFVEFALPSPLKKYPVFIVEEGDLAPAA